MRVRICEYVNINLVPTLNLFFDLRLFLQSILNMLKMTFTSLENRTLGITFLLLLPGFTKETKKNKEFISTLRYLPNLT